MFVTILRWLRKIKSSFLFPKSKHHSSSGLHSFHKLNPQWHLFMHLVPYTSNTSWRGCMSKQQQNNLVFAPLYFIVPLKCVLRWNSFVWASLVCISWVTITLTPSLTLLLVIESRNCIWVSFLIKYKRQCFLSSFLSIWISLRSLKSLNKNSVIFMNGT